MKSWSMTVAGPIRVNGVYSETFATPALAHEAAERATREHALRMGVPVRSAWESSRAKARFVGFRETCNRDILAKKFRKQISLSASTAERLGR